MGAAAVRRRLLLAALASGTLLNPLNSSMIAVALTGMQRDFRLSFQTVSWLVSAFYLASAVGHPVTGRLSDAFGARRTFLAGLAVVAVSSAAAAAAPRFGVVLGARVAQALGTSMLFPAAMRVVGGFEDGREGALATIRVFSSSASAIGPSLGGLLLSISGWWAIFAINLPLVCVSVLLAARLLPSEPRGEPRPRLGAVDWLGSALSSAAVVSALVFLLSLSERRATWPALVIAVMTGGARLLRRRTAAEPGFGGRALTTAYVDFALVNVVFYAVLFGMPSYLQQAREFSAPEAGALMVALSGCGILGSVIAARLLPRVGAWRALMVGGGTLVGGAAVLTAAAGAGAGWLALALALIGFSNGLHNIGLQVAAYALAPRERMGAASGLLMSGRYVGAILAAALLGTLFATTIDVGQMRLLAATLAAVALAILATTLTLRSL